MVVFAVVLGMLSMWGIGYVELWSFDQFAGPLTPVNEAIIASTHEEGIRLVMVVALALFVLETAISNWVSRRATGAAGALAG